MYKYFLILALAISGNSYAELNKWVDENGKVHYSDQPPPARVKAEKLRPVYSAPAIEAASGVPAASAPAAPKTFAEREAEYKKAQQTKKEAADKAAKEQADAEMNKTNCNIAQQNLRALQVNSRITDVDAKGERSFMSDEQRHQRIEQAQQAISTFCK